MVAAALAIGKGIGACVAWCRCTTVQLLLLAMLPPIPTATPVQPCLSSSRARELMEAAESEGSEDLTAAEREQLGAPQLEQRPSGEDGTLSEGHLDADVESEQEGAAGSGAAARQRGIAGAAGAAAASGAAAAAAGRGLVGHPLWSPDAHPLPAVSGHPLPAVSAHPLPAVSGHALATPTVQGHPLASPSAHPLGASPAAHPLASPPGHP